jgi:hypothetical protein
MNEKPHSTIQQIPTLPFTESENSLPCLQEPTTVSIPSHMNQVRIVTLFFKVPL